ncbi:glutathione synthetase [Flavilitoribacter nigricans]|uniref:Glutathione synthetase n=1 Tax=Flavilitoribacter nigricans (strain ATCC 23147 / DSM 23189 / NBRC 102662 / NCIMB 1420 / SS-2) TaxID=1122177 RepID=A0A2D0N854_FLAN2|nr:glutathione synthetase [Flavilitoribacter nigricans]PHN04576.1 glutathione synthetase [Flavilitoribacter nigricans DSM 23189 = NBRC 102662]
MRIAFVVNDVKTEYPRYTSVFLAFKMHNRGHEVYFIGVGDLSYLSDGRMGGLAYQAEGDKYKTTKTYLRALRSKDNSPKMITSDDLDILFLRNDPAQDAGERPWAQTAGIIFGQLAAERGVTVLNDPFSLSNALNKMYFQHFPEEVRPKSIITRNAEEIIEFFNQQNDNIILKPIQGSGGHNVFMIKKDDHPNLNQIIEAIGREGYIIAQEYLPEATKGDTRLFVMNGRPLEMDGKFAAVQRVNKEDDIRSNMHVGGKANKAKIDERALKIAELIRPKLVQDGMFLVGLDIVGDKLLEINVFSPGGLYACSDLQGVDFSEKVIEALENKVRYRGVYNGSLNNQIVASL